jgi:hypothetical protein
VQKTAANLSRLGRFPPAGLLGPSNGFDHRHILDRIRKRDGNTSAFAHGPGKGFGFTADGMTASDWITLPRW